MKLPAPVRAARRAPRPIAMVVVTGLLAALLGVPALAPVAQARAPQTGAPAPAAAPPDLAAALAAASAAAAAAGPVSTAATGARCVGAAFDDTAAFQAAIDTGRTVYAPALGGRCHITRALVMKTPGQIFHGDGRARTKIVVEPGFSGDGVFVAKTGEPGPVWRDFSVSFVQPDTDERDKLERYPPAFLARDTPRFSTDALGCFNAWTCIDMVGNSGGASIEDLHFSAFDCGIKIDGSLDTIRIIDPHWFPFAMTSKQQRLFSAQGVGRPVAVQVGRADDLLVRGGLFVGGLALNLFQGKTGASYGTIDETDFDSFSGIIMQAGTYTVSSSAFTLAVPAAQLVLQKGGSLDISNSTFIAAASSPLPAIELQAGALTISSSLLASASSDITYIDQSGGSVSSLVGNRFDKTPRISYRRPVVRLRGTGRTTAIGNYISDKLGGVGVFFSVENDGPFNKLIGNTSPGWPPYSPVKPLGTYAFN